jgi:spore germination protein PD
MNLHVINKEIAVGEIKVLEVSGSSILLIGDAETIACASSVETPPETSLWVPFPPVGP